MKINNNKYYNNSQKCLTVCKLLWIYKKNIKKQI